MNVSKLRMFNFFTNKKHFKKLNIMSDKEEIFEGQVVKKTEYGMKYVERVNHCPVCGKPDGVYKHLVTAFYMCGRYQNECKVCKEEGWHYVDGTGSHPCLSYMGHEVNLRLEKVKEPYKETVTEDCFLDRK